MSDRTGRIALAGAATFYQEQIPALGWTAEGEPYLEKSKAFLNYKRNAQRMVILLTTSDNRTTVHILLENAQQ